jgi:hypothetical protein
MRMVLMALKQIDKGKRDIGLGKAVGPAGVTAAGSGAKRDPKTQLCRDPRGQVKALGGRVGGRLYRNLLSYSRWPSASPESYAPTPRPPLLSSAPLAAAITAANSR